MTAIAWKTGTSGDWNTASDWSGGVIPGANDDVTIAASGAYTVTIDHNQAAHSVALKAAGATVGVSGKDVVFTIGTSFSVTAGTLSLTGNATVIDQPRITSGTLSTGTAGILLVNAVAGDTGGDEFDANSAVSLAGTTTIASGAFLALGGGGSLGGTIVGGGNLGLGDLAYSAKAATFGASLGELSVEGNGSLALSSTSGTIAAAILLANTGTIAIASGTAITSSNYLQVGVGAILDYQYNSVLTGPGTIVTSGGVEVLDAGTGTDMLLLGGGINWTNSGNVTDYGQIAMNTVSADKVTITNSATGTLILEGGDANLLTHGSFTDGKDTFVNAGLLQRLPNPDDGSGAGTISFAAAINSTGTIDVESGTLAFTDGGTLSGTLSGAGTLLLYSGSYTIGALTGGGHLSVGTGATVTYSTSTINTAYTLDNNDTLAIAAGKTLTLAGPFTVGDSSGGGTISGPGTLVTTGVTTITDLGSTQVLSLQSGAKWINTGTVTDSGIGNYNTAGADGDIDTILNKGTFTFAGPDAGFGLAANGTDIFTNTGTLSRTGTGTSILDGTVNSSGTVNVSGGVLQLQRGGGALSGSLSGAGTLALGDASYTTTGLSGSGTLALNNNYQIGTLTATATGTITDTLQIDGGATLAAAAGKILTVSGPVTIGGSTLYTNGGTLSGAGTITTTGATTIADLGSTQVLSLLSGATWINTGTVTDSGIGNFNTPGVDGDTNTILNKGTFTFAGPDAGFGLAANGNDIFTNTGTLSRTGTATSIFDGTVNSSGTINVAGGVLQLQRGGGALSGILSGAGTLALGDTGYTTTGLSGTGTLALNNNYQIGTLTASATGSITDTLHIDGGATLAVERGDTLTVSGRITIGGSTLYSNGGILSGPGTITTTGTTTIADLGSTQVLSLQSGANWINTGTVTDSGVGNFNTPGVDGDTATILNTGSFTFAGPDAGFGLVANGTDIFTSTGTLARTGTGTSILDGTVNSSGTINVAGGVLQLQRGGGALSGTLSGAGTLALGDTGYTTTGLSGTGTLALNNNYQIGTLTATTTGTIADSLHINGGATLAAAAGKILTVSGSVTIGASTMYTNGGVLSGAGTITTTGLTTIADLGTTQVLSLQGAANWINTGTVTDSGVGNYNTPDVDGDTDTILNKGSFTLAGPDAGFGMAANGTDIFTNTGTLARTGTGTSILDGTVNSSGTINVAGGVLQVQRGGGALSGVLSGVGTLALGDAGYTTTGLSGAGTLALNNNYQIGTLTATATGIITDSLQIDGGATLAAAATKILTVSGPITMGGSTLYTDGGVLSGPGTIITTGSTKIADLGTTQVLSLQGGVTWINTGGVTDSGVGNFNTPGVDGDKDSILNKGTFTLAGPDAGFALAANGTDSFTNSGLLQRTGAGSSSIDSRIAISNTGTIEAAGGTLSLAGGVSGTGILKIDAGATLEIGTTAASQSVTFTGGAGATLQMDAPISRALAGFTAGDRLDFTALPVSSATVSGTTLTVVTASATYTYTSAGLAGGVAAIAPDASGGSFVSIDRLAIATHTPEPLAFGNHHVGDSTGNTLALTVGNTALSDGYSEKLNAGLGGASAGFTASGTVTAIAAGANSATALKVVLDASTAGTKTGTATLTLASNGAGVDGRGTTPLASQTVNLTGAVYNYAAAGLASTSITLGNQHVGSTPSAFLTLTNTAATGGYSEALDAKFTAATGSATGTGTASLIAAGASNSTSLSVGLAPAAAGAATGTETLTFISDGTGNSGLATTTLGTQAVSITATFYNLAAGKLAATTIAFGNHHVGDTVAAKTVGLANSAAAGAFSEKLNAKITTASAGLTAAGTITGLAASASNSSSLTVTDLAASAGSLAGSVVVGLVSDGTGVDGLGTTTLLGQTITVTGGNYALASGTLASSTLNLGIIHAATAATGTLSLTNGAPTGGFGESLDAGLSAASASLSTAGSITGLLAGAKDTSTLKLTVNTAATGAYTGTAALGLVSDGAGTSGLGTTSLGSQTVNVTATVDNYALARLEDPSGPALSGSSTNETLNLGTALQGSAALTATIGVLNAATALADQLGGTLSSTGAAGFTNSGLGAFALLSAGQDEHAQTVSLATGSAGTFSETLTLSSYGTNTSGYLGALAAETLTILGTITPSVFHTYTLSPGPNSIAGADGLGDIFVAAAGALNTRDQITGGSGANSLVLSGAGVFDVNAPSVFTNIPKITAFEGQAASGTLADTRQLVLLRDGATETLSVTAGTAAAGNANPEAISIYAYTGTDSITLAGGADQVFLGTGNATVKLGGVANSVIAGGGIALVTTTAALASASVVGTSTGSTTLEITTGGAVTLNAADTNLYVKLDAAGSLKLSALGFIAATGSSGADTLTAMGATQTLTGGAGADTLIGYSGGNDGFVDTAAGLNGDTIQNWTTGDSLDLKNIVTANLHPLTFAANKLTVTAGTSSATITFSAAQSLSNFTVAGSDGAGGTIISFHT